MLLSLRANCKPDLWHSEDATTHGGEALTMREWVHIVKCWMGNLTTVSWILKWCGIVSKWDCQENLNRHEFAFPHRIVLMHSLWQRWPERLFCFPEIKKRISIFPLSNVHIVFVHHAPCTPKWVSHKILVESRHAVCTCIRWTKKHREWSQLPHPHAQSSIASFKCISKFRDDLVPTESRFLWVMLEMPQKFQFLVNFYPFGHT